ncbi:3495_t:CDS:2 [Funneliformis geosporum]|uniref:3495_t:CDS:1 n=1 Tax=Funneliformis geosporum TaxID=1117311 RepID=A0A9W4SBP1_9GLOM|nr:3495_t:CDS:2 [Funneliformis geosporum]
MTRSTYKFGTPWSTVKAVTFQRPRRLFQNSGASRRGSVVGNVLSHIMTKTSITSRNSRIEFPFTVTDQENLRIAVQELSNQKATSQIPTTATTESTITVTSNSSNSLTQLRKKGSKKFVLSFSNISNSTKNSTSSTPKKSKSSSPAAFIVTIEDKNQILSITRTITEFIEFDQKLRQEFPKPRPTLPSLDDRRRAFLLPKHFFFRKSTAEKLESYLRKVLTDINLKHSVVLKDFLSVKNDKDSIKWKDPARSENLSSQLRRSRALRTSYYKSNIDDYDLIKVLGKGCMGKVFLSREKHVNKLFALKAISKEWVVFRQEVEHTKTERDILASIATISHPFLISLRESFQDSNQLFLVLDYYPGGDIATQLAKWHKFDDARCLFYAAEIVLGIEELHRLGIVYRDLKPENILIGRDGHIVLTDFGLSKQFEPNWQKTKTFCGTAEYLAPEIIRAEEYSYPVDWWSLGTLLYEMMTGITPFWAEDQNRMYQRVLEDELIFPDDMTFESIDILRGLLQRNPMNRLGCGPVGSMEIKTHSYFNFVNWDDVYHKRIRAPYIPTIEHETDLQNFDDTFVSMSPKLSIPNQDTMDDSLQQCFAGYSFSDRLPQRSPSSLCFKSEASRKSITSSLAAIPSHGSRSSMTLPGGYDYYDKQREWDYEYDGKTTASDDISEYELDQHSHYSKRRTIILGDNNMKYRNPLYLNPRYSQFMEDASYGGNSTVSTSSSSTKLDRRGNLACVFPHYQ